MDRCVVDVLKKMPERDRFVRGMVSWIGFKQIPLHYARLERVAGSTKYSLSKMTRFALDAILSFSLLPLRLATISGLTLGMISCAGFIYVLLLSILKTEVLSWPATRYFLRYISSKPSFVLLRNRRRIFRANLPRAQGAAAVCCW